MKASYFELAKQLFVDYPVIETISWVQYTPYFNDGEETIFSANLDSFQINGDDRWDAEYHKRGCDKKVYDAVEEFLNAFDEDDYKDLFGDHVKITLTAKEILTSEYDHD